MSTDGGSVRRVWCVWTEEGEYEQLSRHLHGIFATPELARALAERLRATGEYDVCEVIEDCVLYDVPERSE